MMDRGTQRELIKALLQLNEMLRGIDFSDGVQRQTVVEILEAVNKRCNMDFTALKAAVYAESLSGLAQIIGQTDWLNLQAEEKHECRNLCQDIIHIVISKLRQEKEIKKDIVFLPYKASMWDSLESVWRAASEDKEHCNTYVIPIPYADRNPDGTVATWHCEAELFPKDVPVLDWNDYPFEKLKSWHPDVIFIHNPYDNYNAVTSIDKQYYSSNLKKCTDRLVYIPYFVLKESKLGYSGNTNEEDKIANFILAPGVINADYTIVQSEKLRKIYINVLMRHTDVGRRYWEEHILGLGSPKYDKVTNTSKEYYKLPQEWYNLIQEKKVVLYNTGLTTMLRYGKDYLNKICSVLSTFKSQHDVVLWWRPHPLLRATFQSMYPELLEEYDDIVNKYRSAGWGIYDDTADLNRAVAWTDAYYGDSSSVVSLYEKVNKPIIYEAINRNDEDGDRYHWKINIPHGIVIGGDLYFTPMNYKGLFVFQTNKNRLEHLSWLGQRINRFWCCGGICSLNDKLFLAPANNEYARIVDFNGDVIEEIPISRKFVDGRIDTNGDVQFYGVYLWGERIWMIPHHGKAIVSYDLRTKKVEYYPEIYGVLRDVQKDVYPIYGESMLARGSLWIIAAQSSQILQFDLISHKVYSHDIDEEYGKVAYIEYDGEFFWLYTLEGVLICWTPESGQKKKIVNPLGIAANYGAIKCVNRNIWIIASYQDVYGIYNIDTDEVNIYRNKINNKSEGKLGIPILKIVGDDLYLLPYYGNLLVCIHTKSQKVDSWIVDFSPELKDKYHKEYAERYGVAEWELDEETVFYVLREKGKTVIDCNINDIGGNIYRTLIK